MSRPRLHHLAVVAIATSLIFGLATADDPETVIGEAAWAPRRMWQFAVLASLGSALVALGSSPNAKGITTPALLSVVAATLGAVYVLRCDPASARLGATPLKVVTAATLALLGFVIFSAVAGVAGKGSSPLVSLGAAAAVVGAVSQLAGMKIIPGGQTVPIFAFGPLCILLGVGAFRSTPAMTIVGKVGTVLVMGAALERIVFGCRLLSKAKGGV